MLDAQMRRVIDVPLNGAAPAMARAGVRPNHVTIVGFLIGLVAVPALAYEAYVVAFLAIVVNRVFDGLDGAIARATEVTDFGGYLDIVCDFIFYAAVVFGFALARPENGAAASFLMLSFVATGSSFLAYAIVAAKMKRESEERGRKSFFYIGGLTEGTETIALFLLITLIPNWFVPAAWIFGTLAFITAAGRVEMARRHFRPHAW